MSATNRGTQRRACDFYPTPTTAIHSFLNNFPLKEGGAVLEPGAGSGNIIKVLQQYGNFSIDAVEIRGEELPHLQELNVNVMIGDYLTMNIKRKYDLIIGNPPFGQAIEFVEKSLNLLKPTGTLTFLLRTAFLESDKRFLFWSKKEHQLAGLYTLHRRPSFTGNGTDATSYSWFVWQPQTEHQVIKVI